MRMRDQDELVPRELCFRQWLKCAERLISQSDVARAKKHLKAVDGPGSALDPDAGAVDIVPTAAGKYDE